MTGGRYFGPPFRSLRIFGEINRFEKTTVQHVVYRRFDEAIRWPLAVCCALALELVCSAAVRCVSVIAFDAPAVLALAPVIGGFVWFSAAWARRVRVAAPRAGRRRRRGSRGTRGGSDRPA
jgi:hypothetical protein